MSLVARISRAVLAVMLLACAAWVAMPLLSLLRIETGAGGERPVASAVELVRLGSSFPQKHVIPEATATGPGRADEVVPPPAGPVWREPAPLEPTPSLAPTMPLPARPEAITASAPPLEMTYRSAVETPPPPLLDASAPPPFSVAWPTPSAHKAIAAPTRPIAAPAGSNPLPETYAIRDGDDLTGIAVRFYGTPSAADSIWRSNRDRLTDPDMLPIGLVLRLPASGSIGLSGGPRQRMIEPQ